MKKHWKYNFFILWSGQAVSIMSSSIVQMAIIWYLTDISGSAMVLSIASLIGFLPQAILGTFIGVAIDRHHKKNIMIVADIVIAIATFVMIIISWIWGISIGMVYVVLFIRAVGSGFHSPCLSSVTPSIVPLENLSKCAGYSQSILSTSFIISPIIAGMLYAWLDLKAILALDVFGAMIALISLCFVYIPKVELKEGSVHVWKETKEGFQVLRNEKGLYYIVILSMAFSILFMPLNALFPLMSMDYFQGTSIHASFVESSFAIGMLFGSLLLGIWGGFKKRYKTMTMAVVLVGLGVMIGGALPTNGFIIFVICCFVIGFASPLFNGTFMTLIQERIDPQYLGRVFSLSGSIMSFAMPVGLALCGMFADEIGVNNWFLYSGIGIILVGLSQLCLKDIRKL